MVPVIASRGASFVGAFAYYCHDKKAWTSDRVAWTQCLNLMTDCIEKAWKRMAYTAKHQKHLKRASGQRMTGAKMQKPVFCYSLSWHPEQNPSEQSMMEAVMKTLQMLGLADHQAIVAAHRDEPHPHVHIIVNAVHPLTGLVAKLKNTKRILSEFALNHERKEGKVYCPKREENHARREAGRKTKYCDPVIVEAWEQSATGAQFVHRLEAQGYQLARGRKRLVIVNPHGKPVAAARALDTKVKQFYERIRDLDTNALPTVEEVVSAQQKQNRELALTELSTRHAEEIRLLKTSHENTIERQRQELSRQFRLKQKHASIRSLEHKLSESGALQRIFGLSALRRHRLNRLKQAFTDANAVIHLALEPMKREEAEQLNQLGVMQAKERAGLEREFL